MKSRLIYWHKARIQSRYILEMKIHQIEDPGHPKSKLKYRLICFDIKTGRRILMDNHHPKGPHIHVDQREHPYSFTNENDLIVDFKRIVLDHMEVKL